VKPAGDDFDVVAIEYEAPAAMSVVAPPRASPKAATKRRKSPSREVATVRAIAYPSLRLASIAEVPPAHRRKALAPLFTLRMDARLAGFADGD
jgi:hypothetical protein